MRHLVEAAAGPARPRLFVAGGSLGSFGGETAFSGEYDLRNRTAGTLFAGPPSGRRGR
ncbi:alpha/beta-hydrolase family protein [Streptomyces pilosus]|uniref:alpha/beta-hydrolase family protein n=1 Tax=Streptomyces pilosus TaxID=28893 RepID=UPI0036379DDF